MAETPSALKETSSVQEARGNPPFGSRFLVHEGDVWQQNAWDHVPPPSDHDEVIAASLTRQRSAPVPVDERTKYNQNPSRHWDNFYKANSDNFFRNRNWLHLEFPELLAAAEPEAGSMTIAELGCGAGNTVFPLLTANRNPKLRLQAHDYSSHAVKLVQQNPMYLSPPVGTIHASVWDMTSSNTLPSGIQSGTVDIVVLVFVMSALHPDEWGTAIANIYKMLKPGGYLLFRDYGRHDLTQLRFKTGRLLQDNFYIRGDKTRVYFFELDEVALLFTGSPLQPVKNSAQDSESQADHLDTTQMDFSTGDIKPLDSIDGDAAPNMNMKAPPNPSLPTPVHSIHSNLSSPPANCLSRPLFRAEQLGIDRRLLVNRKRQLKMHRVWIQAKFVKLPSE